MSQNALNNTLPEALNAPKSVSILGCTGSIGKSTASLIEAAPERYKVMALAAKNNVDLLVQQAKKLVPEFVAIEDESHFPILKEALAGTGIRLGKGREAIIEAAQIEADWTISAIVGAAALNPTLAAIRRGGVIALANKECLVCAGELVMAETAKTGATLLPVDSEHNAIFQAFDFEKPETVEKITLTASGGPFRTFDKAALSAVTAAQAVKHPNWSMGAKISVDSATMMNKGLEVIEAFHLFPVKENQIDVVIHPESIVHGLVSYTDGSMLAGLSATDMCVPIAHTLHWPNRGIEKTPRINLTEIGRLTFEAPDLEKFPALKLAREVLKEGGTAPIILNAANEIAVGAFIEGRIGFLDITKLAENAISKLAAKKPAKSVEEATEIDLKSRAYTEELIKKIN